MAETIVMPRQGNSVESCVLVKWRIREGESVQPKTIVADVETDKASFEVEAGVTGTVLKLIPAEGDDVPVMQPIAYVGQPGEALPEGGPAPVSAPLEEKAPAPTPAPSVDPVSVRDTGTGAAISPRARLLAASQGVDPSGLAGTGPGGRIVERDVRQILSAAAPATPAALDEARARGLPLPSRGTGPGGRVLKADVAPVAASVPAAGLAGFPGPTTVTKIKGVRKVIADRMVQSLATTAQFTLNAGAPASRLQELRQKLKASDPVLGLQGVTIGDLVNFAVVRTLPRFGFLNAHKTGDSLVEFQSVHLGFACDTPKGLMVPVIRDAQSLSLKQLADETRRLAGAAKNGTVLPDELTGSTFTVTNLGAWGIDSFTPVLNIPEVAILGVAGIAPRAVQTAAGVEWLPSVGLSLTIDHAVVDGAPAAGFLKALAEAIGQVDLLLAL